MAETRSRRKGCPFCGHMDIYEVICVEHDVNKEVVLPSEITRERIPTFTLIVDSDGDICDDEFIRNCADENNKKLFEKRYFFDTPLFMARSKGFESDDLALIDVFWKCKQCLRTWSPVSKREFTKCPRCGMRSGIHIMYGMPTYNAFRSMRRGELSSGGCCINFVDPNWVCKECGHHWGGLLDVMKQE